VFPRPRLVFLELGLDRGRSRRERQPRPPLLSRQDARDRERLSWRVRLPGPPLPSPQRSNFWGVFLPFAAAAARAPPGPAGAADRNPARNPHPNPIPLGSRPLSGSLCTKPPVRTANATGCNGLSWGLVFRALPGATGGGSTAPPPTPPSGMGPTARHRHASPQGAELTARYITFFQLGGAVLGHVGAWVYVWWVVDVPCTGDMPHAV
jgi:hypothetical protein